MKRYSALQYPRAFEFNEHFLLFLADSVYSGRFGTFLFDNEKQRNTDKLRWRIGFYCYYAHSPPVTEIGIQQGQNAFGVVLHHSTGQHIQKSNLYHRIQGTRAAPPSFGGEAVATIFP